jgi:SAM-dependent methyltransferase
MGVPAIAKYGPEYYNAVWKSLRAPYDILRARVFSELCTGLTLDAGSGPCQYHDHLDDAVGLDFSRVALKKGKVGRVKVLGSCGLLPFADGVFDSVLLSEVLEHLESPEKALIEAKRVLKVGGRVVVSVPNGWLDPTGSPSHKRAYTANSLLRTLAQIFAGVRLVPWKGSAVRLVAWGTKC